MCFWGECVLTSIYLINRSPTPLLSNITPFERLYNHAPSYDHLRTFGCLCYATMVHPISKFAPRSRRCIFVGYPSGQKGYKLFDLDSGKFFVRRDVRFHETIFPFKPITSFDRTKVFPPAFPLDPMPTSPPLPLATFSDPSVDISAPFPTSPHIPLSSFLPPAPLVYPLPQSRPLYQLPYLPPKFPTSILTWSHLLNLQLLFPHLQPPPFNRYQHPTHVADRLLHELCSSWTSLNEF